MHTRKLFILWLIGSCSVHGWASDSSGLVDSYPDSVLVEFVLSAVDKNPRVLAAQAAFNASDALRSAASRPLYNPEVEI